MTSVGDALRTHHPLAFIESPGTLDGGDVLIIGAVAWFREQLAAK